MSKTLKFIPDNGYEIEIENYSGDVRFAITHDDDWYSDTTTLAVFVDKDDIPTLIAFLQSCLKESAQ